jgi:tetratricopeptide (TPR) repeat protein
MKYTYSTITLAIIVGLVLSFGNVMAAGTSSTSSSGPSVSSEFKAGKKAVKKGDFQSALGHLNKANEKNPRNADINNLLGYSYRKLGDTDRAFEHYRIALQIDPKHQERLKVLDKACRWGCEEYDDLKEAIEKYKEKKKR